MRQVIPLAGLLLGVGLAGCAVSPPNAVPTASVDSGSLTGVIEGKVSAFKGIPYAAPPVGALRWRPPQPLTGSAGPRDASRFGPRCMQLPLYSDMVFRSNGMSEDCLYLNVWRPSTVVAPGPRLPVLVYFYGGGLQTGDGSEPRYDGAAMAAQGIVTVTVNYRLGVFGFMAHPELSAESPRGASGNYGFMDQAAALRWVRRNIAAFGGDPARVTIAGESAGSFSVSAQMASPQGRDLIAGAIGESGALFGFRPLPGLQETQALGVQLGTRLQAPTLAALRAVSAEALLQTTAGQNAPHFGAIVDGDFLPKAPGAIYAAGEQARVPLLAGWNSAEGGADTVLGKGGATEAAFQAGLQRLYGEQAGSARLAYAGDVREAARELASDRFIGYGTWRWIDAHARSSGQPVYRYYYTQPRPATRAGKPAAQGAVHSAEIEYALGNLDGNTVYAWTELDRAVSRQLQAYFANFIKTGNPNGAGLPAWPAVGAGGAGNGSALMVLGPDARGVRAEDGAHHAFHQSVARP